MEYKEPFRLSMTERQSGLWQKLATYLEGRLMIMREKNDNPLDDVNTAKLRGKIEMIKEILAVAKTTDI